MNLSRDTMMQLMAYVDGELEGAERSEIEALIASNAEARALAMELSGGAVANFVQAHVAAKSVGVDQIADRVMERVLAEAAVPTETKPSNVVPLRAKQKRTWPGVLGAVSIAAMAAAALLSLRAADRGEQVATIPTTTALPTASVSPLSPSSSAEMVAQGRAESDSESGIEINGVDSPSGDVSVFYIGADKGSEGEHGASSVVIWLGDPAGTK